MKAKSESLMTEVTPSNWQLSGGEDPFIRTIPANGNITISG